jgi:hypothetical protein
MTSRPVLWTAAVAAGIVVLAGCASQRAASPASDGTHLQFASLIGSAWRLTEVKDGSEVITISPRDSTALRFGTDGSLVISDTVNTLTARYTLTRRGFMTSNAATTLVGYDGTDPKRTKTIAAVDEVVYEFARGTSLPATQVAVTLNQSDLRLVTRHYQLEYVRTGAYTAPAPNTGQVSG